MIFPRAGNYADYLAWFRSKETSELQELLSSLPKYGCGWATSNFRLALERVIRERGINV